MFEIASRIVTGAPDNPAREALRQAEITGREQGRAAATPYIAAAILLCRKRDRED
jgi:hypothetical protein